MLKAALNEGDAKYEKTITFMSDRSKSLTNTIALVFPGSSYAYCLRHLEAYFCKALIRTSKSTRQDYVQLLKRIAYALTQSEYDADVAELCHTSKCAHK